MDAVQHHRETVQPIREKTGGSTFKNPEGTSAWKEIDEAGCRGLHDRRRADVAAALQLHDQHRHATGYDLEHLGETVRARVLAIPASGCSGKSSGSAISSRDHDVQEFLGQLL